MSYHIADSNASEPSTLAATELKATRVIVRVTDLNASITFYRDKVGLPLQSTYEEFAVLGGGDGVTLLLQQVTMKSTANTGLSAFTEVVLESSDVMASYREMNARGIEFSHEPRMATTDGSRDLYAADFKDPDGHILSIAGWVKRSTTRAAAPSSGRPTSGGPPG
jgi:catechol 2,3-dioxygenase-like lactoylglutathione lyase family enzyme